MRRGRSAEDIQRIVEGYRASGLDRKRYCEQVGIGVSTLDYYLMRERKGQRLVRVRVAQVAERGGDSGEDERDSGMIPNGNPGRS